MLLCLHVCAMRRTVPFIPFQRCARTSGRDMVEYGIMLHERFADCRCIRDACKSLRRSIKSAHPLTGRNMNHACPHALPALRLCHA